MSLMKISKWLNKNYKQIMGFAIPYCIGVITPLFEDAENMQDIFNGIKTFNYTKPTFIFGIIVLCFAIILWITNKIFNSILKKQKISDKFSELMKSKTANELSNLKLTYSWGYNYCLYYSNDPKGWPPQKFKITDYDNNVFQFPEAEDSLGLSRANYQKFIENDNRIKAIYDKNENRDRFAAKHIKKNTNKKDEIFDIKMKKTNWISLQYFWDHFRIYDAKTSQKIGNANIEKIKEELLNIQDKQGTELTLNSFCLHLIVGTSNGIVLSRIGSLKENDYPLTFAATLGEQIEEEDFYIRNTSRDGVLFKDNFVENWVKRALQEEFGIDIDNAYEELFDSNSLRVLSIDMEADINNIALTAIIKIKGKFEDWKNEVEKNMDKSESLELKECIINEAKEILLTYPNNCNQYHPSTYIRILMYLRYVMGTERTQRFLLNK